MVPTHDTKYLVGLVRELCNLPHETEWVEFKQNFSHNGEIGEYISALSNGAALHGKTSAYLVWGIEDETHIVTGTNFAPAAAKQGNEPLENWLSQMLSPQIDFRFNQCRVDECRVIILEIAPASPCPVAFDGIEYIRVGSVKKALREVFSKCVGIARARFEPSPSFPRKRESRGFSKYRFPKFRGMDSRFRGNDGS